MILDFKLTIVDWGHSYVCALRMHFTQRPQSENFRRPQRWPLWNYLSWCLCGILM